MIRWLAAFLGFEPIKKLDPLHNPMTSSASRKTTLERLRWPEGSQIRKEIRNSEPAGWNYSMWSWRSISNINRPGSLYPKANKAESRSCLGVLQCHSCDALVRPHTGVSDMKEQLGLGCPEMKLPTCGMTLKWVKCEARALSFGMEEDGVEYSIWEHTGSHHSHPRPPPGRRPPASARAQIDIDVPPHPHARPLPLSPSKSARQECPANMELSSVNARTNRMNRGVRSPPAIPPISTAGPSRVLPPPILRDTHIPNTPITATESTPASRSAPQAQQVLFKITECRECGALTDDVEASSDGPWSCPVCRGTVVWNDAK